MKIAIIYHSESGVTAKTAEQIAEGIAKVSGAEAKTMSYDNVDEQFVNEATTVIFGSPTYYGTYSWQIKKWVDTTKIKLAGKLGGVFATANNIGGGSELAELGLIGMLLVRGMLIYSGGTTEGNPYTHFGAVFVKKGEAAEQSERAVIFGERMARKALELFG